MYCNPIYKYPHTAMKDTSKNFYNFDNFKTAVRVENNDNNVISECYFILSTK